MQNIDYFYFNFTCFAIKYNKQKYTNTIYNLTRLKRDFFKPISGRRVISVFAILLS